MSASQTASDWSRRLSEMQDGSGKVRLDARYIASATDELDAIVEATEVATNSILDAAEKLEALQAELSPEHGAKLTDITTGIYEACNFQDITGQRISKIVTALQHIEGKIEAMVQTFAPDELGEADAPEANEDPDKKLLNGPQLPESANRQDDIDALLRSFD